MANLKVSYYTFTQDGANSGEVIVPDSIGAIDLLTELQETSGLGSCRDFRIHIEALSAD